MVYSIFGKYILTSVENYAYTFGAKCTSVEENEGGGVSPLYLHNFWGRLLNYLDQTDTV